MYHEDFQTSSALVAVGHRSKRDIPSKGYDHLRSGLVAILASCVFSSSLKNVGQIGSCFSILLVGGFNPSEKY